MSFFQRFFRKQEESESNDSFTGKPWRTYKALEKDWKKELCKTLIHEIEEASKQADDIEKANQQVERNPVNIMFLGEVQSGKSSTINTIFSILEERKVSRAKAGKSQGSFTVEYTKIPGEGQFANINFHDVMGLELGNDQGIILDDIKDAIEGKIEYGYKFDPKNAARKQDKDIDKKRQIHCIIFVADGENMTTETSRFVQQINRLESMLKSGPNRVVFATKIDIVSPGVNKDISRIFHSENVHAVVNNTARTFGVTKNDVYPIKNYTDEMDIEIGNFANIPVLLGLKDAVYYAIDFMKKQKNDNK